MTIPTSTPLKDIQTVTTEGKPVKKTIEGVILKRLMPQEDERGELTEMYNPAWGINPDPLVYVYQTTLRPGKVKGWVMHERQEDRLFISMGVVRWALFDNRPESPTYKQLNVLTISERNRGLLIIPRRVFHAVQNVGSHEAVFVNMPTTPYNHADPDKYRLPLKNDLIPFAFEGALGW